VTRPNHREARAFAGTLVRAWRKDERANLARAYLDLRSRARSVERLQGKLRRLLIKIDQTIEETEP